ncbi:hypothetical protein KY290_010721 [Solanum tuberosum]|uniref:Uncharacterized protein n=1 Tax=Solanum tuberosum TaxID=4113 RepID=A0ABQ7VYN8_SOLTU|nr:hypothetical protein KY290_010721 [Solanum tuberosum]
MGLDDNYLQARSQILLMTPLPSVNQAYAMIIGDESQKAATSNPAGLLGAMPDNVVMYSKANSQKFKKKFKKKGGAGLSAAYNLITGNFSVASNEEQENKQYTGLSPGNQSIPVQQMVQAGACSFTKEQYDQIVQLIKHIQLDNSTTQVSCANAAGSLQWKGEGDWDVSFREDEFPFKWNNSIKPVFVDNLTGSNYEEISVLSLTVPNGLGINTNHHMENVIPTDNVIPTADIQTTQLTEPPRRSGRGKQPLIWMKDFISLSLHQDTPYLITNYVNYDNISLLSLRFDALELRVSWKQPLYLHEVVASEPQSYDQASKDPHWIKAMESEIEAL